MEIFPAIDIIGGKAVRLRQGNYADVTVYSNDPVSVADDFRAQGASHLHIVDLDGAKNGSLASFDTVAKIAASSGLFTQVGGGIREMSRIEKYLTAGIDRVILGTAAVTNQELLKLALDEFGSAVAVGVDSRDGKVAVSGWIETTDLDGVDFCVRLRDMRVKTVVYTDIAKDGMLSGPNHAIYERLSGIEDLAIIASGGVSSNEDIARLKEFGVNGAIIGKALYTGSLTVRDALKAAR